ELSEQENIEKMFDVLKSNQDLQKLFKNLGQSDQSTNFFNILLEFYIAYGLNQYNPQYESICLNGEKPIDFTVNMNSTRILIEIKRKNKTKSEIDLDEKLSKEKNKIICALEKKSNQKYSCYINFHNVNKDYNFSKLLESIPEKIEGWSNAEIKKDGELILDDSSAFPNIFPSYKVSLKLFLKATKWDITTMSSAEINGFFTGELLQDFLIGKDGLLPKFIGRKSEDVTIGIIDPSERNANSGAMQTSFDLENAKFFLENIMDTDPKLRDNPYRLICNWHLSVRKNIDAIFLISERWSRAKDLKFEKIISSEVDKTKIQYIDEIYQNLATLSRGLGEF
ncbi:MAG: hypothetical protein ABII74_10605, partial [Elusimicrobiota bacterium]